MLYGGRLHLLEISLMHSCTGAPSFEFYLCSFWCAAKKLGCSFFKNKIEIMLHRYYNLCTASVCVCIYGSVSGTSATVVVLVYFKNNSSKVLLSWCFC